MARPRRAHGGVRTDDEMRVYVAARVERWQDHLIWILAPSRTGTPEAYNGVTVVSTRRLIYRLEHGPVPSTHRVINSCGLSACVALNHLYLVTLHEERARKRSTK